MTVINTNVGALRAQNGSRVASKMLETAMNRLSSGKRINNAKDDAAGLAIATRMDANVRGFNAASDRTALQAEVTQLIAQIGDIATRTTFNGTALLNSASTSIAIQTGVATGQTVAIAIGDMQATALGVNALDISTVAGASSALAALDTAINTVATQRANLGAAQNRLESTVNNLTSAVTNLSESKSRIEDADYSVETTKLASAQILSQASTAMLAQANQSQQDVLNLLR